jgi:hypothetical protein
MASRISQPTYSTGLGGLYGGAGAVPIYRGGNNPLISLIPRRVHTAAMVEHLQSFLRGGTLGSAAFSQFAVQFPILLLRILMEVHPIASRALSNDTSICFGLGGQRLEVVKDHVGGAGTVDDSETLYVNRLWERHPSGSLPELLSIVAEIFNGDGWNLWECVTGSDGVEEIEDIDSLTCFWGEGASPGRGRPHENNIKTTRSLYQRRGYMSTSSRRNQSDIALPVDGNDATVLSLAWRPRSDNPYGRPRYSAALPELLCDLADEQDLAAYMHRLAYARMNHSVDLNALVALIEKNADTELVTPDGKITIVQWLQGYISEVKSEIDGQASGDEMVSAGVTSTAVQTTIASAVPELRRQRLSRLANGLLNPLAMLNINDGGSLSTASGITWEVQAEILNALRARCYLVPVWMANLDLRARGVNMVARMAYEPIKAADLKAYYEAEIAKQTKIFNEVRAGITSEEEASMALTGSGLADPERAHVYFTAAPAGRL